MSKKDSLEEFFGSEDKPKSLKEILESDDKDRAEEKERKEEEQFDLVKIGMIVVGALVIIGMIVFAVSKIGTEDGPGEPLVDRNASGVEPINPDDYIEDPEWYFEEGASSNPFEDVPEWATKPWDGSYGMTDEMREDLLDMTHNTKFKDLIALTLPTEENGYTSNVDESLNEDLTINPFYSYWTAEKFTAEANFIATTLLNPTFGNWGVYQLSEGNPRVDFNQYVLQDLFTERYAAENFEKEDKSYFPVYADWNDNDYGLDNIIPGDSGGRFFGQITDATASFERNAENTGYVVSVSYSVEFKAFDVNGEVINKTGKLDIVFVQNTRPAEEQVWRVLVDNATLTVN